MLTKVRPAVGRLLGADIRRYTLLFGLSAALLAETTSLAIGSYSMQLLGTEQIAAEKADRLPAALLISAQSVLDQRDGRLSDPTFEMVTEAAEGRTVSSRWQSTISSGTLSREVVGVTPGDWYSQALSGPSDVGARFWQRLRDTVELPTVEGPKRSASPRGCPAADTCRGGNPTTNASMMSGR